MANLVPIDHDPFAGGSSSEAGAPPVSSAEPKLTPVDHDPFSGPNSSIPQLSKVIAVTEQGYPIFENPEHTAQFMKGVVQGTQQGGRSLLMGLRTPIDAGAQLLTRGLEAIAPEGSSFQNFMHGERERVEDINKKAEGEYQAGRTNPELPDYMRGVGEIAATAPVAAAIPGAAAGGLLARTAAGVAGGAATGALHPVYEPGDSFAAQKAKQVGVGAAAGAVIPAVVGGTAKVIAPDTSQASSQVRQLMDAGVTPTPGQILGGTANRLEEAGQSIPLVGDAIKAARGRAVQDFNRAEIDQALSPIGQKLNSDTPLGRDAIAEMKEKIGTAYDSLLPKLKVQADPQFITNMRSLVQGAQGLTPGMADKFDSTIRNVILRKFSPGGGMTGESFKEVESELGTLANSYSTSALASERELGGALKQTQAELRDLLTRSNPNHADELGRINQAFSSALRVEGAAGRIGSDQGVFTPAQMLSSVRQLDPSMRKGAFARGEAPMQDLAEAGKSVLGNKVPDSGTPFRSLAVAAPALAGMYMASPAAAIGTTAAGLGTIGAYSRPGVSLLASLLSRRPSGAGNVADILRRATPVATSLPALLAAQPSQPSP